MKKILIPLVLIIFISCGQDGNDKTNKIDSIVKASNEKINISKFEITSIPNYGSVYIINVFGTKDMKEAVEQVKGIKVKGYPAAYLWIPDFPSLSKKEMYSVFIGPFERMDSTLYYLEKYKKTDPNAYALEVGKGHERITIMSKFDVRKNNVKQFLIIIFDNFGQNKGDNMEWLYAVDEAKNYFGSNYPDKVMISNVSPPWMTPDNFKALKKELDLYGYGFILINGKKKSFEPYYKGIGIDFKRVCDFFGLKYIQKNQSIRDSS